MEMFLNKVLHDCGYLLFGWQSSSTDLAVNLLDKIDSPLVKKSTDCKGDDTGFLSNTNGQNLSR